MPKEFHPEEVLPRLNIENLTVVDIIPAELESQILTAFPDFKQAQVDVGFPAAITLTVEERVPAITWIMDDGHSVWIDEDGYIFDVRGEATLPVKVYANVLPPAATVIPEPETETEISFCNSNWFGAIHLAGGSDTGECHTDAKAIHRRRH